MANDKVKKPKPEVDLLAIMQRFGSDEQCRAYLEMLRWPDGTELHGYGHYHETYEKIDGTWRITTSSLSRLRMDFTNPSGT